MNLNRFRLVKGLQPDLVILVANQTGWVSTVGEATVLSDLEQTLNFLSDIQVSTVVQGQIPDCYFPLTLYGKYSRQIYECGVDISDQSVRNSLLIKSKALTLRADSNVFIDPSDVVCPESKCRAKREIGWIYSDLNHLSPTGSKLLTPLYVDAIQKVLATKSP